MKIAHFSSLLGLAYLFSACGTTPQGGEVVGLPGKCYVKYIKASGSGTANVTHSEGSSDSPGGSVGIKVEVTSEYQIVDCDPKKKAAAEKITAMSTNLEKATGTGKASPETVKQLLVQAAPVYASSLSTLGVSDPRARRDVLSLTRTIDRSAGSSRLLMVGSGQDAGRDGESATKASAPSSNRTLSLKDIGKRADAISRKAESLQ